jgi:hypothetical protein
MKYPCNDYDPKADEARDVKQERRRHSSLSSKFEQVKQEECGARAGHRDCIDGEVEQEPRHASLMILERSQRYTLLRL